ncbi:MAG: hypothetical protein AD742_16110 [Methylibium sp. NZG]|nr:MAG: hypothetical protein AD742_16110 [Methylibium sp. NZG]
MRELFVYYRVRVGHEATALSIVIALQTELKQRWPGLTTRLMRRPVEPGSPQTWMETYAMTSATNGDGVDAECERAIEAAALALATSIDGVRHTEVFVPAFPAVPSKGP